MLERDIASSEPIQEDWGWALLVDIRDHTFVIYIGVMDDSVGTSPAEWRVGVTYERFTNRLRHLFRKPDRRLFDQVCAALDSIVTADPRLHVVERVSPT
jgi:hypothetical protein